MTLEERQVVIRQRLEDLDKLEPQVSATLRGNNYILEFDNRACKGIFKEIGFNPLDMASSADLIPHLDNPNDLTVILYWAMKRHQPEITVEQVDELISLRHRMYLVGRLVAASSLFYPDLSDLPPTETPTGRPTLVTEKGKAEDPLSQPLADGSGTGPLPEDSEYLNVSSIGQP